MTDQSSTTVKVSKDDKIVLKSTFRQNVYNLDLQKVDLVNLSKEIWNIKLEEKLVHQILVTQQSSWRLSTKKVKDRSEVSGGGRKPWKQKGTGRARHGSNRSPIWKGGGVVFGPTGEENYCKKDNRKVFRKAIKMLLTSFRQSSNLFVWQDVDLAKPKTKTVVDLLSRLNLTQQKVLFIAQQGYSHLKLSLNNLKNVKMILPENLNPYDLTNSDKLLIEGLALPLIEKRLQV